MAPAWVELLSGEMVSADAQVQVELQPHHTKVFSLFPPEQGNLDWWRGPFLLMADGSGRVLKDNAITIHAMVKGAVQGVQTDIAPPPGWTAQPLAEREGSWRLLPRQDAHEGEAEVTAQVTSQDGKTMVLRRTVRLIPADVLELATDELDLTLNVPYQIRVPVRNNSDGLLSASIKLDLPEQFEVRSVEGTGEVLAGSVAVIGLTLESPLKAQPGVYKAEVSVGENRYNVRLNARKGLLARRLASPPTLDGVLNEWIAPPSADEFRLLGKPGKPTQETQRLCEKSIHVKSLRENSL